METKATDKFPFSNLRHRLIWARQQLGFQKQRDFAAFLGEKGSTLAKAEGAGGRGASERLLYRIEEKAGISKEWLKTGKGEWRAPGEGPGMSEVAQLISAEIGSRLEMSGISESRLREILQEAPPLPTESSRDFAVRIIALLRAEIEKGDSSEPEPAHVRKYDPVELLNLVDRLEPADQLQVLETAEKLSKRKTSAKGK